MRIVYHHRTLGDGAEGIHIREMVDAFRGAGHEVHVVALVGEPGETRHDPVRRQVLWQGIRRLIPAGAYELAELSYNSYAAPRLMRAARRLQPSFLYDRYNSYSTAAATTARKLHLPFFLEVNAPVAYERTAYQECPLRWPRLARHYERRICNQADHLFAVSTPLKEFLVRERGVDPAKVTVLPNGAAPEKFDPAISGELIRQERRLGDRTVIGFVGILRPWHGIDLLFRAFAQLDVGALNLHLLIVGDGPLQVPLEQEARRLGIAERVTFTGHAAHRRIPEYIAAMDVAVSPRTTFYASPMKILEYMAMAVPTVAPRTPNIEDILDDGCDGLLFDAEDDVSLAAALSRAAADPALRGALGRQARRKIEQEFNWKNNARVVLNVAAEMGIGANSEPDAKRASLLEEVGR